MALCLLFHYETHVTNNMYPHQLPPSGWHSMAVATDLKAKGAMNGSGLAAQLWEKQAGYWWNDEKQKNPSRKTEGTPKA